MTDVFETMKKPKHGDRRYRVSCIYENPDLARRANPWDRYLQIDEVFKSRPKAFARARELAVEHGNKVTVNRQQFYHWAPPWSNLLWDNVYFWEFVKGKHDPIRQGECW